jgi:hypothetical protein
MPSSRPVRPAASSADSAGSRSSKSSSTPARRGPGPRRGARRGTLRPGPSPRGRCGRRSARGAARRGAGGRGPRPPGSCWPLGRTREMLGDGVLGHTEAGEEGGEAIAALVRQFGPRPGVRARSMALASHCRRATMCEKKDGHRWTGEYVPSPPLPGTNVVLWRDRTRDPTPAEEPPGTIPSRIRASVGVPACLEPPYQDFAPGPASLRISDSDERGPGQCSSIISSPPPRRIARNVRATTTASSS